jgi:hypothetical protein
VHAVSRIWVDKHVSTKEKPVAARTPKILAIKTCSDKAGQPSRGKVDAYVFGRVVFKDIYDNDNEQDARDITEHEKPK